LIKERRMILRKGIPTFPKDHSPAEKMKAQWRGLAVRLVVALVGLCPLVLLTGCNTISDITSGNGAVATTGAADTQATPPPQLKLSPGDKLHITVFGEDKLSGDFDIDPSGYVSIPLGGTVMAAGLSKPELEALLTKKLKGDYLRDPKVTVDVASFRPFYILGEVEKPGEYPYKGNLNVMTAIAIAGGNTFRASNSTVLIKHEKETALHEYPLTVAIPIYPGDLIRVPERYF
jgi:protein involved in polysaccharide export with SLBB domain